MPEVKYRFSVSFEVNAADRVEVKTRVVDVLNTLKSEGKISKISGSIREFHEFSTELITT